jgi:cell division protein FtsI (penicillin-binding protein 3)
MKTIYWMIGIALFILSACSNPKVKQSGLDTQIQEAATIILQKQLPKVKADSGLILVMDVKSGQIKAGVNLQLKDSTSYLSGGEVLFNDQNEPGSLILPIVMMAALETGKITLNDSVDAERGYYKFRGGQLLDANYNHGGFGKITRQQAIIVNSNIGVMKTVEEAFSDSIQSLSSQLEKMSVGEPYPKEVFKRKSSFDYWLSLGYEIKLSPVQLITFYNAIANNGKMVYEDKVLNPHIANETTIQTIQKTLEKIALHNEINSADKSLKPSFAGKTGGAHFQSGSLEDFQSNDFDVVSFCGYFPVEDPQFTCLIMLYSKEGNMNSNGSIAAQSFKELAEKVMVAERNDR